MRKNIKSQIIDLIETIVSGIEYAASKSSEPVIAYNMLMDCYEGVMSLGERLQNNASKDNVIEYEKNVNEIKDKLELLNDKIANSNDFNGTYREILNHFELIREMMIKEKTKLEILFLPYKASMWDSLESIWQAADEDENCDAYVMPIPYYEKNPDGSLGEMHYEGYDFPENVPVIDWKAYSLENRKPDVIYVHNPYDGYNLVTTVHPNYYSDKLKQYTNTLVYVPYYANGGGYGETLIIPPYYNFDYIVVQTETMKKSFKDKVLQDKILVLGTPKFDRVINMCKEKPEPPENWKSRMTGKKVYLYNTALASLLLNTEVFLRKMKYVFDAFVERQDSLLLWRPHPLFESTIKSMRPQYYLMYLQLKKYFLENNIGIIDTTTDIEKSIALSDGYISVVGSSVETLVGIVGKPMFMLNTYINEEAKKDDWRGEMIRFTLSNPEYMLTLGNKLFEGTLEQNKLEYKYICDSTKYPFPHFYNDVQKIKDKIYLCYGYSENIGVIENNSFKSILPDELKQSVHNFVKMFSYQNYIVFISFNYPAILRYNIETGKVDCYTENLEILEGSINDTRIIGGSCIRNNIIFIASPKENYVVAFDILEGKYQLLTTASKSKCGCIALMDDGVDLWFMPMNGATITRWNPNTGKVKEYLDYPEGFSCINPIMNVETQERPFFSAVDCKDFVLFAPWWANMFIKLNKKTGEMTEWNPPFAMLYIPLDGYYYSEFGHARFITKKDSNEVYIATFNDKKLYKVNLITNDYEEIEIVVDEKFLKDNMVGFTQYHENYLYVCFESIYNTLEDFLDGNIKDFDREKQINFYRKLSANSDGTCGEKIYEFIAKKQDNV